MVRGCQGTVHDIKPDNYVRPERRPWPPPEQSVDSLGGVYPAVVVEVSTTQSLSDVHKKVDGFGYKGRQDQTLAMVALVFQRANGNVPTSAISFATADIE